LEAVSPRDQSVGSGEEKRFVAKGTRTPTPWPSSLQPVPIPTALARNL
jgi:hypothetical protein